MSGLYGIVAFDGPDVSRSELEAMARAAPHRGPDGNTSYVSGRIGFGFLSFRVTPESLNETQPLVDPSTGVVVMADVRLDNREQLFEKMSNPPARSAPDVDYILKGYLQWGEAVAEKLLGDFTVAIWDPRNRHLLLLRDPMALRTLYVHAEVGRRIVFATEVKQIFASGGIEKVFDLRAAGAHLAGIHIPPWWSFFKGIEQVEPGSISKYNPASGGTRRFYSIQSNLSRRSEEEFGPIFESAVKSRLRTDRPVGISLSGGIDSGSAACQMGKLAGDGLVAHVPSISAYTWAFDQLTDCDERMGAGRVANLSGLELSEVPADDAWPLSGEYDQFCDFDDPYQFYYSTLVDRMLEKAASDGIRAVWSCERGDAVVDHWVYDYPGLLFSGNIAPFLRDFEQHRSAMGLSFGAMLKRSVIKPLLGRRASGELPIPDFVDLRFAGSIGFREAHALRFPTSAIRNAARRMRYQLIFSSMSVHRSMVLDRICAAKGMVHIDPWSDRRIAELVVSLPQHLVHRFSDFKRLPRHQLSHILPPHLKNHADSLSKANPTSLYRRGVHEREACTVRELIRDSVCEQLGMLNGRSLSEYYEAVLNGMPEKYDLWWFLTLEMWLRKFQ